MILRLSVLFCLVIFGTGVRGVDDFDLGDALAEDHTVEATPKPGAPTPKPGSDNKPTVKPQPGGGGFGDSDLGDLPHNDPHNDPSGKDEEKPSGGAEEPPQEKQGVVAGIVSAVAVAAVGAVSSFIAYQKKKLCFKGAGAEDPENVNADAYKGDQSEPQVQSTLLAQ